MPRPLFTEADFVSAAREVALGDGPRAITVSAVASRLGAPVGSFYHRFQSRDVLACRLWLDLVRAFQVGFFRLTDAGEWREAALHVARWSRANPDDARLLLAHGHEDFVGGALAAELREAVAAQAAEVERRVALLAEVRMGGGAPDAFRRARYVMLDAPLAAVRPYLKKGEPIPAVVDDLIGLTFDAVAEAGARG